MIAAAVPVRRCCCACDRGMTALALVAAAIAARGRTVKSRAAQQRRVRQCLGPRCPGGSGREGSCWERRECWAWAKSYGLTRRGFVRSWSSRCRLLGAEAKALDFVTWPGGSNRGCEGGCGFAWEEAVQVLGLAATLAVALVLAAGLVV